MGGVHVTALPQEALQTGQADIVVRGEGEETMRKLYFAIQDNQEWKDISGISYLNNKGEVVDTPDGDLLQNIEEKKYKSEINSLVDNWLNNNNF